MAQTASENTVNYAPPPSLVPFLTCDSFVSLISGPVGSGKSSAAMMKIAYHAKQMKAGRDGVRRSRAVVVRNTNQMLNDATIPTFMTWFPEGPAGSFARTEKKFFLTFDDVICEVLFRGLDDANDVRRLLSLEVSFGILDEYREIHPDIFNALQGRVGRFPSMANGGCVMDNGEPNNHVWGATNAPDADTFWEDYMSNPPKTAKIYQQPSALSEDADWTANLIAGYYETLAEGKTEDWVDVYIHNKFGRSLAGTPVYEKSFTDDFHVAKDYLLPNGQSDNPIIVGVDFGRTPCAIFKQRDTRGRVLTLSEVTSTNMGIETFIREKLTPHVAQHYPGYDIVCAPDPAGFMKQQLNELTLVDALKNAGYQCVKPPSNKPDYRIQAVERLLMQQVDGQAMYLIDPRCTMLVKGFRHGYRYKRKKNGEIEMSPDKNEYSHIHDANQYADSILDLQFRGSKTTSARREVTKVRYAYT
jgi:hypothetical protein